MDFSFFGGGNDNGAVGLDYVPKVNFSFLPQKPAGVGGAVSVGTGAPGLPIGAPQPAVSVWDQVLRGAETGVDIYSKVSAAQDRSDLINGTNSGVITKDGTY